MGKKIMIESITNSFQKDYGKLCRFASDDCEHYLSNLYSCQKELNQEDVHPAVWEAMEFQTGTRMALERAKLGSEAIHRFEKEDINEKVLPCPYNSAQDKSGTKGQMTETMGNDNSSGASALSILSALLFIFTTSVVKFLLVF